MSQRIIYAFESIERYQQNCAVTPVGTTSNQGVFTLIYEQRAVSEVSELIVIRQMLDLNCALSHHLFQMILVAALLFQQTLVFERALYGRGDLPQVERLGYVIECARPHCFNRVVNRLLAADHDDYSIRRVF